MKKEYEKPGPNDKLWRYMDLGRFIHLLLTKKLYFASAASFEDPFEGAKGLVERKEYWDSFYLDFFRDAIRTVPGATQEMLEPAYIEKEAQRILNELNKNGEWQRQHTFINCWHCNPFESEAMWKLYSVNIKNAVAIQTTAEHLYLALNRNPNIEIGKVNYIDFNKGYTSINGAYWYKRQSFEHEREVRAITMDFKTSTKGISIPIDINTLIDQVYISPYSSAWFEEVVQSVMEKFEIPAPIVCSEMAKQPFY